MANDKRKTRNAAGDFPTYTPERKPTRLGDDGANRQIRPLRDASNDCAAGDRWNWLVVKPRPEFADLQNTGSYRPVKRYARFGLK